MVEEELGPHIIIDNGTAACKAGFSGEEGPRSVFPTCVGYPKDASGSEKYLVGADAIAKRDIFKLNYPIKHGDIKNWDEIEKIWFHIFDKELHTAPEEHNVMLTEPSQNPKKDTEKMAQIMFETLNVPGLYIANQAKLSLYNAGLSTSIVVDTGDGATQIVPFLEGYMIPHAVYRLDFGGNDLTEYMIRLLEQTGMRFSTSEERDYVKAIKEKSCYVALDFEEELKSIEPFDYEYPDGTHAIIKEQRIRCTEALFNPILLGKDFDGIAKTCYDSIQRSKYDIGKDLYNNIILSGGNSMFNGFKERLTKEIKDLAPESIKEEVHVIASPERKFAVWIGGSILSQISTFESMWVTKTEYEESGATIVHKKCL